MAQKFLSIKNFEKYQHYKHRDPPWIKLYKSILTDPAFMRLSTEGKYLYLGLLILASETDNRVLNDPSYIAHRLCIDQSRINLKPLYDSGFLLACQNTIRKYHALSETEKSRDREETETETPAVPAVPRGFEVFWMKYPRKKAKGDAERAWAKIKPDEQLEARILDAVDRAKTSADWTKDGGMYIPYPASWLNAKGWEDEPTAVVPLRAQPVIPPKPPANDPIGRGLWEQSFGSLVKSMR